MNKEQILEKLNEIMDPELGISIVDLGLIYGVHVSQAAVDITMTLTTPICPLSDIIKKQIEEKLKGRKKVHIALTFDPPWTWESISEETRLKLGLLI